MRSKCRWSSWEGTSTRRSFRMHCNRFSVHKFGPMQSPINRTRRVTTASKASRVVKGFKVDFLEAFKGADSLVASKRFLGEVPRFNLARVAKVVTVVVSVVETKVEETKAEETRGPSSFQVTLVARVLVASREVTEVETKAITTAEETTIAVETTNVETNV